MPSTQNSPDGDTGGDGREAIGQESRQVNSEKEMLASESDKQETLASLTSKEENDVPCTEEKAVEEPPKPAMEYPKGVEVFFIMAALIFSITLISLDQVRFPNSSKPPLGNKDTLALRSDTLRPLSQPPFPKSRTSSTASTTSPGTAPRTLSRSAPSSPPGAKSTSTSPSRRASSSPSSSLSSAA